MAKRKIIQKNAVIATQLRDVLNHYNQFVRSLHIKEKSHSPNSLLITRQLIKKLIIVGMGAFFTTAAFYFLMDPLRIYNPGLNGLLKKITQCLVGTESVGTFNFYLVYYGISLVLNSMIIYSLWKRHRANLEIVGTALFYIIFQALWTGIFWLLGLENFLFGKIDTKLWPLTLPLYLVVGLVAAAVHVQGYSIIFQVQAAPSGFETITAHFATKKKPLTSLKKWSRNFSVAVLFILTLWDFFTEEQQSSFFLFAFIKYIFKNGRLWGVIAYIYASPRLMNWTFPRDQTLLLRVYSSSEEKRSQALNLLKKFTPTYQGAFFSESGGIKTIYVIDCYLSGWDYFILKPELQKTGQIHVSETN